MHNISTRTPFQKIILGSGSPRRKQLLEGLGLKFEVRVKDIPEDAPGHLNGEEMAIHLAAHKAEAYQSELKDDELLITADTIVWLDKLSLAKPQDSGDAARMLRLLSGRSHQVFTGVCLTSKNKQQCFCTETKVWFKTLDDRLIQQYVSSCKPYDKAGAYGAQEGLANPANPCSAAERDFLRSIGKPDLYEDSLALKNGAHFPLIDHLEGSYFNVMGLPVADLWRSLAEF